MHLSHDLLTSKGLPDSVTLGQLIGVLQQRGMPAGSPMVRFGLNIRKEELDASKTDSSKSAEAEEGMLSLLEKILLGFFGGWEEYLCHSCWK